MDVKWKAAGFSSGLKDISVNEGTKAKLTCKVTGNPEPDVTWLRNGSVVKPDKGVRMTFDGECFVPIALY